MRAALLLGLLVLVSAVPLTASVALACPVGEALSIELPGGAVTACLQDVPLLAPDARIVEQTGSGPVELSKAGIRTLGGSVLGDPTSFVRVVEAPGWFAGLVRTTNGFFWLDNGAVRTQPLAPIHTVWVDPALSGASPPTVVRILPLADAGFLHDRGATWHLWALTVMNVVDGAFRAQSGVGWQLAGLTGGNPSIGPVQRDVDVQLAGNVPGISPLGYAYLGAVYGGPIGAPGFAWVRTSAALARPQSCLGGPYEGTLFGSVSTAMHELGHTLDLPWLAEPPVIHEPVHDPWYNCDQDPYNTVAPWLCSNMGGWHGEGNNCMEILPFRVPIYAGDGVLAPVLHTVPNDSVPQGVHVDR